MNFLKSIWNDDEMYLAIPFYDSFIFNNVIMGNNCIPSFSFTKPIMLLEQNELLLDSIVRKRVLNYAKSNDLETQEIKAFTTTAKMITPLTWHLDVLTKRMQQ